MSVRPLETKWKSLSKLGISGALSKEKMKEREGMTGLGTASTTIEGTIKEETTGDRNKEQKGYHNKTIGRKITKMNALHTPNQLNPNNS